MFFLLRMQLVQSGTVQIPTASLIGAWCAPPEAKEAGWLLPRGKQAISCLDFDVSLTPTRLIISKRLAADLREKDGIIPRNNLDATMPTSPTILGFESSSGGKDVSL